MSTIVLVIALLSLFLDRFFPQKNSSELLKYYKFVLIIIAIVEILNGWVL
ncbi:hypothetical protein IGI43_001062 [Enterococcus sp. AZ126]